MGTIFLVLICLGFVVCTGIYIAVMNRQWWGNREARDE